MRVAALLLLLAGCSSGYVPDRWDFSDPSFDFGAASDLGFFPSDASMALQAELTSPVEWASLVPLDATFEFTVKLPRMPSELEGYFQIVQRPAGTPLAGAFSWKGSGGVYSLSFIPSAELATGTDFEVRIAGDLIRKPTVGVSTGSHPRVGRLTLVPVGPIDLQATVSFSEPMKDTTYAGKVVVLYGTPPSNLAVLLTKIDSTHLLVVLPSGQTLAPPITVQLKPGIQAATGTALDPKSWDSGTDVSGSFEYSFPSGLGVFVPEIL